MAALVGKGNWCEILNQTTNSEYAQSSCVCVSLGLAELGASPSSQPKNPTHPTPQKNTQGQCILCDPLYSCPSKQGGVVLPPFPPHRKTEEAKVEAPRAAHATAGPSQHAARVGIHSQSRTTPRGADEVPAFCSLELIQILSSKSQSPGTWGKYDFLLSMSTAADLCIGTVRAWLRFQVVPDGRFGSS